MLLEVGLLCLSMLIYLDGENQTYLCLIVHLVTQIDHLTVQLITYAYTCTQTCESRL